MFADLVQDQAGDLFRIGLLVALMLTMLRTRDATGVVTPLAAGIVFVAVIIPVTQGTTGPAPLWLEIAAGIVVNTAYVLIGVLVARMTGRLR